VRLIARIGLPPTIGATLLALFVSLAVLVADAAGLPVGQAARAAVGHAHFRETLLDGLLPFLLFAGALDVDLDALLREKLVVGVLSTAGVVVSTVLVGALTVVAAKPLGFHLTLGEGLLFGALISPTDPIAVLGMLRASHAPERLEVQMAGESLFNDGVGVVVFFALAEIVAHRAVGAGAIGGLLLRQVAGGLLVGTIFGRLARRLLRRVGDHRIAIFVMFAVAIGLYGLANRFGASGLLAVIVAGLLIGRSVRSGGDHSSPVAERLPPFWAALDNVLNFVLFTLIGLEALVIPGPPRALAAGLLAIPIVLLARLVVVAGTLAPLARRLRLPPHAISILTWGGLRGGLALALALSVDPAIAAAPLFLTMTYVVVVFSIVVQGATFKRLLPSPTPLPPSPTPLPPSPTPPPP
jgi:monovalent cation:H+ antiporter, CPA1 family